MILMIFRNFLHPTVHRELFKSRPTHICHRHTSPRGGDDDNDHRHTSPRGGNDDNFYDGNDIGDDDDFDYCFDDDLNDAFDIMWLFL